MTARGALLLLLIAGTLASGCEPVARTYAAACSRPREGWGQERDGIGHLRVVQPIGVRADGAIRWNGAVIPDAVLRRYMAQMSAMNPEPQAVLEIAPTAPCERVQIVRAIMAAAPLCQGPHPLCSEGRNWRQWPVAGGP